MNGKLLIIIKKTMISIGIKNLKVRNNMCSYQVIRKVATKLIAIYTYTNVRGKYYFGGGFDSLNLAKDLGLYHVSLGCILIHLLIK